MPCLRTVICVAAMVVVVAAGACSPLVQPPAAAPAQAATRTDQKDGQRSPALAMTAPNYDHFEGVAFRNACYDDHDCKVTGCSSEICSADAEVSSACLEYPDKPVGASCGCVNKSCTWYQIGAPPTATAPPPPRPDAGAKASAPEQGQPCPNGACAPGLECVTFFGVAGPRGGAFTSCEIRCSSGRACPQDQQCVGIADGPGQVCRPK